MTVPEPVFDFVSQQTGQPASPHKRWFRRCVTIAYHLGWQAASAQQLVAPPEADLKREPRTHDLRKVDYSFTPHEGGRGGHIASWSAHRRDQKPDVGDYLILRNGEHGSRYRATSVNLCLDVDPPTMWMADLVFAPRAGYGPDPR